MDHNEQIQKMYQQHRSDGSQTVVHPIYSPSELAARFRQSNTIPPSPTAVVPQTFGTPIRGYVAPNHFAGSPVQGGFHYQQFTAATQPTEYSDQHQHQTVSYGPGSSYYYGHQQQVATSPVDQAAQEQMQRFQSAAGRNASTTSASSQYSLPQTPHSQYFAPSSNGQYPTRVMDARQRSSSMSFDSTSYTQASSYHLNYQTSGQMLPPSSSSGYQQVQQQQSTPRTLPEIDAAYEIYQNKAREIFTLVRDGQIRETYDHLLYISRYLIGNAETLGLDKDDQYLYEERLKLWDTFNNTWLTALQAQLDQTREMIALGGHAQALRHPRSLLGVDQMEELGHELVKLCDGIAVFGLVDYQMGVAEEHILGMLIKCLDLISPQLIDTPRASRSS